MRSQWVNVHTGLSPDPEICGRCPVRIGWIVANYAIEMPQWGFAPSQNAMSWSLKREWAPRKWLRCNIGIREGQTQFWFLTVSQHAFLSLRRTKMSLLQIAYIGWRYACSLHFCYVCVSYISLHFLVLGTKMQNSDSIRKKRTFRCDQRYKITWDTKERKLFSGEQKPFVSFKINNKISPSWWICSCCLSNQNPI